MIEINMQIENISNPKYFNGNSTIRLQRIVNQIPKTYFKSDVMYDSVQAAYEGSASLQTLNYLEQSASRCVDFESFIGQKNIGELFTAIYECDENYGTNLYRQIMVIIKELIINAKSDLREKYYTYAKEAINSEMEANSEFENDTAEIMEDSSTSDDPINVDSAEK